MQLAISLWGVVLWVSSKSEEKLLVRECKKKKKDHNSICYILNDFVLLQNQNLANGTLSGVLSLSELK